MPFCEIVTQRSRAVDNLRFSFSIAVHPICRITSNVMPFQITSQLSCQVAPLPPLAVVASLMVSGFISSSGPAFSVEKRPFLPAAAAFKAAEAAVNACRRDGYGVTATVVNSEGMIVAQLRGDSATPHTLENSFNKAYTAITLGPVQKVDSTAKIFQLMKSNPGFGTWPLPPAPIRGFTFNPGGLVLYSDGQVVGGIGISGAPKGIIDEGCATKGREAAQSLLR